VSELLARHPAARDKVLMTSAEDKSGIDALRDFLADFAVKT
jgi:ethanolamine utilization protein EutP (predicted NTPase)